MTALDQNSGKAEQSIESSPKHASLIQSPADSFPAFKKADQPELKVQGDNIEVPPITVKGWQNDATTRATNANFIELPNPYQDLTLDVAGRKWTDLGAGQPTAQDVTRAALTQAAPPPKSGDRSPGAPYAGDQDVKYDLGDGQGPPVVLYSDATVQAIRYEPQQFGDQVRGAFNILANAVEGVGKALWALTPFRNSVNGGRLGCAASVSEVLQRSGYQYANSAGVGGLEGQLMRNGWTKAPLSQAAPEDVVMVGRSPGWRAGGGSAHVGIVGENGSVYHNSSSRGQWVKDNLQARFGRGGEMFVLKPPADGKHSIDTRLFYACNPEPSAQIAAAPRFWIPENQRQQQSGDNQRTARGYQDRDTRYSDNSSGYRRYDRFQPRSNDYQYTQDPAYSQRDRDPRLDPQYDDQNARERQRVAEMTDRRSFQQRMMDRVRRQFRS